jgi:uncharacterized protein YndB with AHSA1/START domain
MAAKTLHKERFYPHPPDAVWTALTDPRALAEWLMPNNFEPVVGRIFRFHVDPMPGFSGISECRVLEVDPPKRLSYTWQTLPKQGDAPRPEPMTLVWTLTPSGDGTVLSLDQTGLEHLSLWWRFSMRHGWSRMLNTLLPRVLPNVRGTTFTSGAITKRDYGTKTVPPGYAC